MNDLKLRAVTSADAEALGAICFNAFKNISDKHNFPPDFASVGPAVGLITMLASMPGIYGVAAEIDGKLAGSNFLWESDAMAGIGPITIDPNLQNGSIGRELMADVIRRGEERGFHSIRLVQAAYHNRSLALYTKLGFDTVEPLSLINGEPVNVSTAGRTVRAMKLEDVDAADKLCRSVHGHSRKAEITGAAERGSGLVVEKNGGISGYTTVLGFFGHTVGESNDDLKALIGSGTEIAGSGFLLPTRNSELMRWCLENSLKIIQPMTLMSRGVYQEPRGVFMPSILY